MQPDQLAAVIARDLMNHGEQEMATSVQFHNKHGVFLSLLSLDELTEHIAKHLRGEIEHSPQPVDWPTSPGWWWMEYNACMTLEVILCEFDGRFVWKSQPVVRLDRDAIKERDARFLPAHIPKFPEREAT